MIDFACEQVDPNQIIRCALGLSKAEQRVLQALGDMMNTKQLAETVSCSISLAQRRMKALHEKELVTRRQINLDNGGYEYRYQALPSKEIKQLIQQRIEKWCERAKKTVAKTDL